MNLLPFVIIVIMVLGLFSLSQFEGAITQKRANQIYLAYFQGLRKARDKKITAAYRKTRGKTSENPTLQEKSTEKSRSEYFRIKRIGWDKGRLNLSSLLEKPHKYPHLENIAIKYIEKLYGNADFFQKRGPIAKDLLQALVEHYKGKGTKKPFHELTFKDHPKLQEIFYKMVKGTHYYDLEKKGYPPFGEMFTFEESSRRPMNYDYANLPFLSLLFGEEVKEVFVDLEKQKLNNDKISQIKSPIREKEFKTFVNDHMGGKGAKVLELLNLDYKKQKQIPAKHRDKQTDITVKVP